MKKVITIYFLVVNLLVGGMTVEAKTTKKKAKERTTQTTSTSKINKLLNEYEEAVDILSGFYNPVYKELNDVGYLGSQASKQEEKLYQKLKKLENSMTSEQKSKFNKLSHLYKQR